MPKSLVCEHLKATNGAKAASVDCVGAAVPPPAVGQEEESWNCQGAHQEQAGDVGMGKEAESECVRHKCSAGKCVGGVRHAQVNVCLQQTPKSSHKRQAFGCWPLKTLSNLCLSGSPSTNPQEARGHRVSQ